MLQPDQRPERWDDHVGVYEAVFEPLTNVFAAAALDRLALQPGERVLDIAAGSGGAALLAARAGAEVVAVDASPGMVARIRARAQDATSGGTIAAEAMDGTALALPDASFAAALSVFGVVLFPDAEQGMREMARVLKPGGRCAVVTWTDIERYELAARLLAAIAAVRGPPPPPPSLPAQLRYREEAAFRALFDSAGLAVREIVRMEERWRLPSARWLAERVAFAPGMAAMLAALDQDRPRVLAAFVDALERDQGTGEIGLEAVAHLAVADRPG